MSHLHLPDGVLPIWVWVLGYIVLAVILVILIKFYKLQPKKIALAGMFSALMLVIMSIELPIGYHFNLTALAGILLGPTLSVLAVFVVNTILAFVGHGGITIIGLNTLVLSLEAIIAFGVYRFLKSKITKEFLKGFISALFALIFTAFVSTGVVYIGTKELPHSHQHHEHHKHHEHNNHKKDVPIEFDIKKFFLFVMISGSIGWVLESALTGGALEYIAKVKPDILENNTNNENS